MNKSGRKRLSSLKDRRRIHGVHYEVVIETKETI